MRRYRTGPGEAPLSSAELSMSTGVLARNDENGCRPGTGAPVSQGARIAASCHRRPSPRGQSEPSMRLLHRSTEKLSRCCFLPFSYEPCFHTHAMKSRLGPMQKGFCSDSRPGAAIYPAGSKAQDSRRSHQKNKTALFSTESFLVLRLARFLTPLSPPPPRFSRRTADRSFGLPRVGATTPPACVPPPQPPAASQSCHCVRLASLSPIP